MTDSNYYTHLANHKVINLQFNRLCVVTITLSITRRGGSTTATTLPTAGGSGSGSNSSGFLLSSQLGKVLGP